MAIVGTFRNFEVITITPSLGYAVNISVGLLTTTSSPKNLVRRLRDDHVDLSKKCHSIYEYFWGMENYKFVKGDLKSLCKNISLDLSDIDPYKTIELFDDFGSLRRDDPSFMFRIELDDIEDQFNTVLWTNGHSRMQYAHFGDTITFDTTYMTNLYGIPFGLFVGVNNHHQSIILGGALMRSKTVESFKWLFREFVILMGGKAPSTILTGTCFISKLDYALSS